MGKFTPTFMAFDGVLVLLTMAAVLLLSGSPARIAGSAGDEVKVVPRVDVARYMGKWFEIASIPASFQKACVGGTTADYTLRPDGMVGVLNQCYEASGRLRKAKGQAWVVDEQSNAKLKVSFIPWVRLDFLSGDYWIIDLGPDYEYAVVGHPSRTYGWILSRTPELLPEVLEGIMQRLEAQGYDRSRFKMTNQKDYGTGAE